MSFSLLAPLLNTHHLEVRYSNFSSTSEYIQGLAPIGKVRIKIGKPEYLTYSSLPIREAQKWNKAQNSVHNSYQKCNREVVVNAMSNITDGR